MSVPSTNDHTMVAPGVGAAGEPVQSIDIFPWNDHFDTGLDEIDRHHRKLVQLLNRLAGDVASNVGSRDLDAILAQMADYTDYHFRVEEAVWHQYLSGDRAEVEHKSEHARFRQTVEGLKRNLAAGPPQQVMQDALEHLTRWLASHILCQDRQLAHRVLALRSGMPPEAAEQRADRQATESMDALIDVILTVSRGLSTNSQHLVHELRERKALEQRLRDSEAQANLIIDTSPDAVILADAAGAMVRVNPQAEKLFGYGSDEMRGLGVEKLIPERLRSVHAVLLREFHAQPAFQAVREHGRSSPLIGRRKDGSEFPFEGSLSPVVIGGQTHIIVNLRDITERRTAERTIREDRERQATLRELLENVLKGGGLEATLERCLDQLMSVSWLSLLPKGGIFLTEEPGKTLQLVAAHDIAEGVLSQCAELAFGHCHCGRAAATSKVQYAACVDEHHEIRYPAMADHGHYSLPLISNGEVLGVLVLYLPLDFQPDAAKEQFLASVADILAGFVRRKQVESALERHRHDLEDLVTRRTEQVRQQARIIDQSHDSVVTMDLAGNITTWNRGAERLFGIPADKAIGRNIGMIYPPEEHDFLQRQVFGPLWEAGEHEVETRMQRADGSRFPALLSLSILHDDNGAATGMVGFSLDITPLKRAELATQKALAEARRLAQAKSDFLANMSHEIRTPLNGVLGLARIGARDHSGEPAGETFARIEDAGQHLLGVINDVLEFSRLEAGKLAIEARPLQINAVVNGALDLVSQGAEAKGLALVSTVPPGLPEWVRGDPLRLQQILANLLANAVKFTQHGEVRLDVERDGVATAFRVTDSGIGMSSEQIQRLFAPFEQADSSTTRNFGGSGLGLAISQNLARMMDGDIRVRSRLNAGSTFTLTLPLAAVEPAIDEPAEVPVDGPRLTHLRVLAAEDVELNRFVLEDLLVHEGAHVVFAENGRQVLQRVDELGITAFDVVLMDVQMPVLDGLGACRELRALAPDMPVIGLTAHALTEEREKCFAAGMVAHVTKPVDADTLVAAIRRHVPMRVAEPAMDSRNGSPEGPAPSPGQTGERSPTIDWEALRQCYNGRQAFIDKLMATALRSLPETGARLRDAAQAGDRQGIAFLAHTMKGVASNLAARAMLEQARITEAAARGGREDSADLARRLADLTDLLLAELARRS